MWGIYTTHESYNQLWLKKRKNVTQRWNEGSQLLLWMSLHWPWWYFLWKNFVSPISTTVGSPLSSMPPISLDWRSCSHSSRQKLHQSMTVFLSCMSASRAMTLWSWSSTQLYMSTTICFSVRWLWAENELCFTDLVNVHGRQCHRQLSMPCAYVTRCAGCWHLGHCTELLSSRLVASHRIDSSFVSSGFVNLSIFQYSSLMASAGITWAGGTIVVVAGGRPARNEGSPLLGREINATGRQSCIDTASYCQTMKAC